MNAFGYGPFIACIGSFFLLGLFIGWFSRNASRQSRIKQAGIAAVVLALFYPAVIALLAFGAVSNPFTYPEGRLAIGAHIGLTFILVAGLVGLPLVAGVAVPPRRTTQPSESGPRN